jgi:hypothetical protein
VQGYGDRSGPVDELAGVAHIIMKATSVAGMERRGENGMRESGTAKCAVTVSLLVILIDESGGFFLLCTSKDILCRKALSHYDYSLFAQIEIVISDTIFILFISNIDINISADLRWIPW